MDLIVVNLEPLIPEQQKQAEQFPGVGSRFVLGGPASTILHDIQGQAQQLLLQRGIPNVQEWVAQLYTAMQVVPGDVLVPMLGVPLQDAFVAHARLQGARLCSLDGTPYI